MGRDIWPNRVGRGRVGVAFFHHHPAHIRQNLRPLLIDPARAHHHDAGFAAFVFAQANDLRAGRQSIARKNRRPEKAFAIAQIGQRMARDIGHGFAKDNMKHQPIFQRALGQPKLLRERRRRHQRIAPAIKGLIERAIAIAKRARRGMCQRLA